MKAVEKAGYLAHAESAAFGRKLSEARKLMGSHPDHVVCVSWGKDSTVLYDLARTHRAAHGRYREEERFPDLDGVRDTFGPSAGYTEVSVTGAWDMFDRVGGFFFEPETTEQKEAYHWYHERWEEEMLAATGSRVMLGLRRDESANRSRLIAMRGQIYETKGKARREVVLPLANWSGKDVWAYLLSRNLPYARIYDASFSGRERTRSDFTFGAGAASHAIWRHGAWEDWKLAYPEQFRAWLERFPEMRRYV